MDRTRRIVNGLLLVVAVPLGVLAALPLALLLALFVHLRVLWQLAAALGRGAKALPNWLLKRHWPLVDDPAAPATLALPRRN